MVHQTGSVDVYSAAVQRRRIVAHHALVQGATALETHSAAVLRRRISDDGTSGDHKLIASENAAARVRRIADERAIFHTTGSGHGQTATIPVGCIVA